MGQRAFLIPVNVSYFCPQKVSRRGSFATGKDKQYTLPNLWIHLTLHLLFSPYNGNNLGQSAGTCLIPTPEDTAYFQSEDLKRVQFSSEESGYFPFQAGVIFPGTKVGYQHIQIQQFGLQLSLHLKKSLNVENNLLYYNYWHLFFAGIHHNFF